MREWPKWAIWWPVGNHGGGYLSEITFFATL